MVLIQFHPSYFILNAFERAVEVILYIKLSLIGLSYRLVRSGKVKTDRLCSHKKSQHLSDVTSRRATHG